MPLPITPGFAQTSEDVTLWTNDTGASTHVEVRLLLPTVTDTRKIKVNIGVFRWNEDGDEPVEEEVTAAQPISNETGSDRVTVTVAATHHIKAMRIAGQEKRFMKFKLSDVTPAAQADSDGGESA